MKKIKVSKKGLVFAGIGAAVGIAGAVYKLGWDASFKHFSENALEVEDKIGDLVSHTILERVKGYAPDSADQIDKFKELILLNHGFPYGSGIIDYTNKVVKWSKDGTEWMVF